MMRALPVLFAAVGAVSIAPAAVAAEVVKPMQFFEGRTEGSSLIKILMKKPFRTRSVGIGRMQSDGSLLLIQRVEEEGRPAHERRWKIRQTGPRSFSGTMSEAVGPVTIDQVGARYRFRFKMKGNLAVEQWLSPMPGGKSATNSMTVRKLGVRVGTGEGTLRKVAGS